MTVELLYDGSTERGLTLDLVKRDWEGRVIEGWVVNGGWTLMADHELGVYWPAECPTMRTPTSVYTGWSEP